MSRAALGGPIVLISILGLSLLAWWLSMDRAPPPAPPPPPPSGPTFAEQRATLVADIEKLEEAAWDSEARARVAVDALESPRLDSDELMSGLDFIFQDLENVVWTRREQAGKRELARLAAEKKYQEIRVKMLFELARQLERGRPPADDVISRYREKATQEILQLQQ